MARNEPNGILRDFAFHDFLWQFYGGNRGKIRSRYNDLTKKFLDFNDKSITPTAYLRAPQFEALEMYVFIKEFMDNAQVYKIFDEWYNRRGDFAGASYYSVDKHGQQSIFDMAANEYKAVFGYMRKDAAVYPNYIYALTMGLGKTVLMATCIFYEFLLMNKYPKDKRFCHNALVFAPDKTVLESLREIITFDKSKVVPAEYCHILDANIKFHFLDESGTTLNTLDNSDFNIIISNTQKIIKKRIRREKTPMELLLESPSPKIEPTGGELDDIMADLYGDDEIRDAAELTTNQRFEKLARLQSLGIYVDEAHHMFGKDLQKSMTSLRLTINELAAELTKKGTSVIACYNYTGTPYTDNTVLPEVVYSYGLREAIFNNYLKEADIKGYENVKSKTFIGEVIREFWERYGGKTYEGLAPKLAIFGTTIDEVTSEIRPIVEETLAELGIPQGKVLVNVGDEAVTKSDDIKHFNDLDRVGTVGAEKQFILLCNKGREGWNCRSLFGVALFRSPKSTIFVLQATMRCLRQITDTQQKAIVRLSKDNLDILDAELNKNFRMNIDDMGNKQKKDKELFEVRLLKNKTLLLKEIIHTYAVITKLYPEPPAIDFGLSDEAFLEKYKSYEYAKAGLTDERTMKQKEIRTQENRPYGIYTLTAEISAYLRMHAPCSMIEKILRVSKDGAEKITDVVSQYNQILYDRIIPCIFNTLFEVKCQTRTVEKKVELLRLPEGKQFYEFMAEPKLTVGYKQPVFDGKDDGGKRVLRDKSFHTDYYCFDSVPENKCFWEYIKSDKVKEVYFMGMFTSKYNGLSIQYIDPETNTVRSYYPDFISFLDDDTIQIVEVKGDNKIDDLVVRAKADAAAEMATESKMSYVMLASNDIMRKGVM
jgi:hypothetical protein